MSVFAALVVAAIGLNTAYLAPTSPFNSWRLRTEDGCFYSFGGSASSTLVNEEGWTLKNEGSRVVVREKGSGTSVGRVYSFVNGRIVGADSSERVVYEDEELPPLWDLSKEEVERKIAEISDIWKSGSRFRLWFKSPNQAGVFLSFLVILMAGGVLGLKAPVCRILCLLLSLIFFALLFLTGSRGAVLALSLSVGLMVATWLCSHGFFKTHRKLVFSILAGVVVLSSLLVAGMSMTRGARAIHKSDETRAQILTAAVRMIYDAPGGWGTWRDAGAALSHWYLPESNKKFFLNLVNDHLTVIVARGVVCGCAYLFVWFAGVLLLVRFAARGGTAIPAAMWLSLGIAAGFNVILPAPTILYLPVASLVFVVVDRRWMRRSMIGQSVLFGGLLAVLVMTVLWVWGSRTEVHPSIFKDGPRICVNGKSPDVWILADARVLGYVGMEMEIRNYYREHPDAPAIGCVERPDDLPACGIRRLVVTGSHVGEFMRRCAREGFSRPLPPEVVLISPNLAPSEIPRRFLARTKVLSVIGEFAARYSTDFAHPPKWCLIVSGAEIYIPGWMRYCVN